MDRIKRLLIVISFFFVFVLFCSNKKMELTNSHLKLWYQQPAKEWTAALPVGNGRLGAMVFGQVFQERIQLNEESVWAGSKINNNNPQAQANLPKIRDLLFAEKNDQAYELIEKSLLGTPPRIRSYQTLGDLFLEFDSTETYSHYQRELNLETGLTSMQFEIGGKKFRREIFCSAVDDILAIRLAGETGATISTTISLTRSKDAVSFFANEQQIILQGQIVDEPDSLSGPGGAHLKFAALLQVQPEGGKVSAADNHVLIRDAKAVTILFTAATDYNIEKLDFDRSLDPLKKCQQILARLKNKSYQQIKRDHIREHQTMFNRVSLDLGKNEFSKLPTDERLSAVRRGKVDPDLVALYFQFGRYLLMNSSRLPGVLPANLQGIWNEHFNAPWNSDFHTNINLQMNYWHAEVCNLAETVEPLIRFVNLLREPGRVTAKETYGASGWTMHHLTDPFGRTGVADGVWGVSPMAGPWMTFPIWEHFEFNGDKEYLQKTAYPIMKESAEFVLDFLIQSPDGYLITSPSHSPENRFFVPGTRQQSYLTYAATIDIQIITELFHNCLKASEILDIDEELRERLRQTLTKLPPLQIGKNGTIQEWIKDYEEVEPGHRHMSHLLGLHPGSQITADTPALFAAARRTIERRLAHGGGQTGWSRAWAVNFFARLNDGDKAQENLLALLRRSTLPNLFDTHPPFQIDGNFGGTAGMAEMLVQSQNGIIHILPALPTDWPKGQARGLCARGGFVMDIVWEKGKLTGLTLFSKLGNSARVKYKEKIVDLTTEKNKSYTLTKNML